MAQNNEQGKAMTDPSKNITASGHETGTTILIVDDEPTNLTVLSQVLQPHYRVRAARSGEQALRAAITDPRPDLVLLDIMMPDMDGYSVLTQLRNNPVTRDIPVIFVTALSSDEDEQRGLELGAVDYMTKPIRPMRTLARVRTHLELKAAKNLLEVKVAERTQALKLALEQINQAHASLKESYFETLRAISSLAELRGGFLGEHARHVANLSRQLAASMGMSEAEIQEVFIAALLHDIGKIGFPDELLNKPVSQMNSEDLALYRQHPVLAADALKHIKSLEKITDIIRYHHEHFDGSGFPEGRRGLDIPLGASIICAVSDYDDMKSGALTTQPMTARQACKYLLDERGLRYDIGVVDKLEPLLASQNSFEIDEVRVSALHLQTGMMLSRDVYHPDGYVLLSKSTVTTHSIIEHLVGVEKLLGKPLEIYVARQRVTH